MTSITASSTIAKRARPSSGFISRGCAVDARGAEEARELAQGLLEGHRLGAGLPMHGVDAQHVGLAVEGRIDSSDQPVTPEDRQHVVAVLPLRLWDIHLEAIEEAEQRLRAVAVVDEPVERREERRAEWHPAVGRVRMGLPLPVHEPDPECAPPLLLEV